MNKKIVYTVVLIIVAAAASSHLLQGSIFGYDSEGRRDPFVSLIIQEKKTRPSSLEEMVAIEDLILEGIAISPSGKNVAILNGRMVKEQDRIGAIQIKKISKKNVELSINGKDYGLSLTKEESVKVGE
ncbi:MAG: hypothetical protein Q8O01_04225 [Candidatus Omnitrophota bacterium]|nr:hypothetical protein [Candidatus Omnitrophota bacterium]